MVKIIDEFSTIISTLNQSINYIQIKSHFRWFCLDYSSQKLKIELY